MPELEPNFHFTQMCLQDYITCERRFQLRYLMKQPWPAQVIEPVELYEQHVELGKRFHQLVHQYLLGLPVGVLNRRATSAPLSSWWQAFIEFGLEGVPAIRLPEITRTTSLEGFTLTGKFDLIAIGEQGRIVIIDWKTSRVIPGMSQLRMRMQSRVYPYIIAREGVSVPGFETVEPDQIIMRYWFGEDPEKPKEFTYSQAGYSADDEFLSGLVHEIQSKDLVDFSLTEDTKKCSFCLYRSLCDRGVKAGSLRDFNQDVEEISDWPESINLDQVEEVEF